jgi:aminoglycoside phosphotransferase (APT) family kinase protein
MTHRWKQTINIDEDLVRTLLQSQFSMNASHIQSLDAGWDNSVYLIDDEVIFRFPRREFALPCMTHEIAILPYIADQVHFKLSSPQWIGQPSDIYPYPFAGYPILPGKSLCDVFDDLIDDKAFAETLALWLKELHRVPVRESDITLLANSQQWRLDISHRIKLCHENLEQYASYFNEAGFTRENILKSIDKMSELSFIEQKKCYVHGDLYHRHIIVDPASRQPTGLIDWGDVHISDPGIDISVGMIFTPVVFRHFIDAYGGVSESSLNILRLNGFAHAVSFLAYGYEQNRPSLKRWAGLQLRRTIEELGG